MSTNITQNNGSDAVLSPLDNADDFRRKNREAWEYCWKYWYKQEYVHHGIREFLLGQLVSIKEERHGLSILDIGCGGGWCAKYYRELYDRYVGVDFNDDLVSQLGADLSSETKCSFWTHDLESDDQLPFPGGDFDVILANFILLELSDLKTFFAKAASVQHDGQYLIVSGLDPLNEIFRISATQSDLTGNLHDYRSATSPLLLTKRMSFNGHETSFMYHRILYSIKDIISAAVPAGYEICEIEDQLNRRSDQVGSPIYYSLKLRRRC